MNKKAELSAGLVAVKGAAAPVPDMTTRATAAVTTSAASSGKGRGEELVPLNFRIPASFRRAFKTYAAEHDMKLNELLRACFEAYREQKSQ